MFLYVQVPKRSGLGGLFQSFSIVTIYTTFVLTAGRVIRLVLTGSAQRVVLEDMKYPDALISLVCVSERAQQGYWYSKKGNGHEG